jgi:hypothetical protein
MAIASAFDDKIIHAADLVRAAFFVRATIARRKLA